jgi:uncharacterized glyoxalase superfamily protein PhnB
MPKRATASAHGASVIPSIRYQDAPAAIQFLCTAFGFTKHLVVEGETGGIAHAQLAFGTGMVMLGSARDDEYGRQVKPPAKGQTLTQGLYVVVADVDGHCAAARAAGADIVKEPEDQSYGGRLYSARDPEGHLWSFGSYDPWAKPT